MAHYLCNYDAFSYSTTFSYIICNAVKSLREIYFSMINPAAVFINVIFLFSECNSKNLKLCISKDNIVLFNGKYT